MAAASLSACTSERDLGEQGNKATETDVEMSFVASSAGATRAVDEEEVADGTVSENTINTLDLLVFNSSDQFQYRRYATPHGTTGKSFRSTLKVTAGSETLTVYFIANARTFVEKLIADGDLADGSNASWAAVRALLVDANPARFSTTATERANLPMWGMGSGLKVVEGAIEHWKGIELLRAVAGVDVYVDTAEVDDFDLEAVSIVNAPNMGFWAPPLSYRSSADALVAASPSSMETSVKLGPFAPSGTNPYVANMLYLYDNDTDESTHNGTTRKYTRIIVKGKYAGESYWYPIDFVRYKTGTTTDELEYDQIVRNTKYVFEITAVTGPGYPSEEIAAQEPPVNMATKVQEWTPDISDSGDFGFDGTYYVALQTRNVTVYRKAGSGRSISLVSNAHASIVQLNFKTTDNGAQNPINTGNSPNEGIYNERFKVEKVTAGTGAAERVTGLIISAVGDFDTADDARNHDILVVRAGNVIFEININQINSDPTDWQDGGNQDEDLKGKN